MKATRRKFFGFMGGAAVAGPSAAKTLAAPIAGGLVPAPMGGLGRVDSSPAIQRTLDPMFVMKRVAELKGKIAGKRTKSEMDKERLDRLGAGEQAMRYQVDALRSVATHHKARMVQAACDRTQSERQKFWWQREIDNLLGIED